MERKTLTLKRSTSVEQTENTVTPVITARRKQVVINTTRRPTKPTKTPPVQSTPLKKVKSPGKPVEVPKEKKTIPPTPAKEHLPLDTAIAEISTYWPNLFPNKQVRPMAIGLRETLLEDKKKKNLAISARKLKQCLSAMSHSLAYRTTIMPGVSRYDKDGQPVGIVTECDVADTLKRIQRIAKQQLKA